MIWMILSGLSLALWLYIALARVSPWRAGPRLGAPPDPPAWPEVVAILPARNEAATIAAVIASLMETDYPGKFSVVLVDDASSDDTARIAQLAAKGAARALHVIPAPALPTGWTGKLAAVNAGLVAARERAPNARYLLLTDADIAHAPETLRRLVAKCESDDLALASLMARLDARGFWGSLLMPAFVYFFQMLYPFARANKEKSKMAAAAGGCMLMRRSALDEAGGIEPIRDRLIDDCALAAAIKHNNAARPRRIWIGLADGEAVSLRDNSSLASIAAMVRRTAFAQLGYSTAALIAMMIGMVMIFFVPIFIVLAYLFHQIAAAALMALAALAVMAASYRPMTSLYGQPLWRSLTLPAAVAVYVWMTIGSARRFWRGDGGLWKGRTYP